MRSPFVRSIRLDDVSTLAHDAWVLTLGLLAVLCWTTPSAVAPVDHATERCEADTGLRATAAELPRATRSESAPRLEPKASVLVATLPARVRLPRAPAPAPVPRRIDARRATGRRATPPHAPRGPPAG